MPHTNQCSMITTVSVLGKLSRQNKFHYIFNAYYPDEDYVAVSVIGQWDESYGEDRKRPFACMCPDSESHTLNVP